MIPELTLSPAPSDAPPTAGVAFAVAPEGGAGFAEALALAVRPEASVTTDVPDPAAAAASPTAPAPSAEAVLARLRSNPPEPSVPPNAVPSGEVTASLPEIAKMPDAPAPDAVLTATDGGAVSDAPPELANAPLRHTTSLSEAPQDTSAETEAMGEPTTDPDPATESETKEEAAPLTQAASAVAMPPATPSAAALPLPGTAAQPTHGATEGTEDSTLPSSGDATPAKPAPRWMRAAPVRATPDSEPAMPDGKADEAPRAPLLATHAMPDDPRSAAPALAAPEALTQPQPAPPQPVAPRQLPLDTRLPDWEARLAEGLSLRLGETGQEIELLIQPEHLGPVEIRIGMEESAAQVRIVTDNPQAAQLFQSAEPRLAEALSRAGLALAQHDAQARNPRDPRKSPSRGGDALAANLADRATRAPAFPTFRRPSGLLNIVA